MDMTSTSLQLKALTPTRTLSTTMSAENTFKGWTYVDEKAGPTGLEWKEFKPKPFEEDDVEGTRQPSPGTLANIHSRDQVLRRLRLRPQRLLWRMGPARSRGCVWP